MASILFWILLFLILYSYLGYTLLLVFISLLKKGKTSFEGKDLFEPAVTIFIAAYNEKGIVTEKVKNLLSLDYPANKIKFLWVTDGSDDGTPELLRQYPEMHVLHEPSRQGKIGAINRGMNYVDTPIVIFCDANSILDKCSVKAVVEAFQDENVGCVAGEKGIIKHNEDDAVNSGEGFYWQYESHIKYLESKINTTIGAAGELFAIRSSLFEKIEPDTILDDFVISLRIVQKGYKIRYVPDARAVETGSASISEELKRKIRIAAGSIQAIPRLKPLLNPFKYGFTSIQYWSHKVIRWTIVPSALVVVFILNLWLSINSDNSVYSILFILQAIFYSIGFIGYMFREHSTKMRFLFLPYYLIIMNYALIKGFFRFLSNTQSVNWEKAQRS
jgi:cellulose synthase/poly-beta-1,6-N-acetylglucosamine synthase-like glycosyltransferase